MDDEQLLFSIFCFFLLDQYPKYLTYFSLFDLFSNVRLYLNYLTLRHSPIRIHPRNWPTGFSFVSLQLPGSAGLAFVVEPFAFFL